MKQFDYRKFLAENKATFFSSLSEGDLMRNVGKGLEYEATEEMIRDYADRLLGAGVDDVEDLADFYLQNPEDLPEPMEYEFFKNNYDDILSLAMTGLSEGEAAYEYEKGKKAGEEIEKDKLKEESSSKIKKSELKAKIKEMIVAEYEKDVDITDENPEKEVDFLAELEEMLNEADETEKDTAETDTETTDVTVDDTETVDTTTTAEVDPNVKAVQDALTQAQAAAQKLGDSKLTDQIGNTITFFTRTHVVEKPGTVAEGDKEYYKDAEADDAEHIKALEKDMSYTAKQIDKMSIEEIEELAYTLNKVELDKWASNGYDGASYVEIIKNRK